MVEERHHPVIASGLEEVIPVQAAGYKLPDPLCLGVVWAGPGACKDELDFFG
jgi:hypothetical protein